MRIFEHILLLTALKYAEKTCVNIIIKKKTGKKFFPNSDKNEDLIVIHMKGENLVCQTLISDPTRILKPFI